VPRPALEVADVFREHGPTWRKANVGRVSLEQLKVMSAIENCRTATLGGHVVRCDDCAHTLIAYNSCLMGKFRNGELTIDSVAILTVFPVIPSRSIHALLSITTVDRRDPRSARSCS
jgi:Transposase zinc-binding domain